jgi:hypothetical protein
MDAGQKLQVLERTIMRELLSRKAIVVSLLLLGSYCGAPIVRQAAIDAAIVRLLLWLRRQ